MSSLESITFTFPKAERLTGEIRIKQLFATGESFLSFPFRIVYSIEPRLDSCPVKVLISVPKKRFKHAVDRNRIKRLIREVYRLNKPKLFDIMQNKDYSLHIALMYVANEEFPFSKMQKKWLETLDKLAMQLQ